MEKQTQNPGLILVLILMVTGLLAQPGAVFSSSLPAGAPTGTPGAIVYLPVIFGEAGSQPVPGPAGITPTPFPPTATEIPTAIPTLTATPTKTPKPSPTPTTSSSDPILVGAGDIARCGSTGDSETAALLGKIQGTVITLGDNAYESGTPAEFTDCYAPTWGQFINSTHPAVGNHDYLTTGAAGYFGYFGAAAGDPTKGYYSYDLGTWHIVVLNSNCGQAGGCGVGSPQQKWLKANLAANPTACTLAYWHHPYYSSGEWGDSLWMTALWQTLYDANADVVLSGHDHDYERFAPQDTNGNLDNARGIVQFVVGTGGSNNFSLTYPLQPNSVISNGNTFGVLELTLHPTSYTWKFVHVSGKTFTDSGTANCH